MATTVHVKGIASSTSDKDVRDFFSFCGKITNIEVKPDGDAAAGTKSATVTFEKETAAKTALLLDNTQLGPTQVHVSGSPDSGTAAAAAPTASNTRDHEELAQEDKPRSRIFAEYLAHGYTLSDTAIERAIALDNKHGFSNKFVSTLRNFDGKYKATEKAKTLDTKYGVSNKANKGWLGLNSYFEKAVNTPTGQKLHSFYLQGDKQVREVHTEARRLADLKAGKATPERVEGTDKTVCKCGSEAARCGCAPGTCACTNCAKSDPAAVSGIESKAGSAAVDSTSDAVSASKAIPEKVSGTDKTVCNCGAESGKCGCAPGQCACANCSKADPASVSEVEKASAGASTSEKV